MTMPAPSVPLHAVAPAAFWHARVLASDGSRYAVSCAAGRHWLRPAASCLLQPAVGDTVLITLSGTSGYVLAVLERAEHTTEAIVRLPGDARLEVPEGALHVQAAAGVSLDAGPRLELQADTAQAALGQAQLAIDELQVSGQRSHSVWQQRTAIAQQHLAVSVRTETRTRDSVRHVSGHDEQQVGSYRLHAEQAWQTHAARVTLTAEQYASLDAAQVRLG